MCINLPALPRLLRPKLPRRGHLVRAPRYREVQKTRSLPPNLWSDPPDLERGKLKNVYKSKYFFPHLILVEIKEVKTAVMLIDRVVIVVAPQMEGAHLVSLVRLTKTPAVHSKGATAARVLSSRVASRVRVAKEAWAALAPGLPTQNTAGCSETTFHYRAWVGRACHLC